MWKFTLHKLFRSSYMGILLWSLGRLPCRYFLEPSFLMPTTKIINMNILKRNKSNILSKVLRGKF